MKKISFLLIAVILGSLTVLTSCKSDDNDDDNIDLEPVLNFIAGTGYVSADHTVESDEPFKIGVNAFSNTTSGKNLTNFKVTAISSNVPIPSLAFDSTFSNDSFQWVMQYELSNTGTVATDVNFTFKITDKEGKYSEKSIVITVEPVGGPIYQYTDIILGSYDATEGSSFASANGLVYNMSNAITNADKVDWMYSFGNAENRNAVILAPADELAVYFFGETNMGNFSKRNATKFKIVTETVDWENIIDDNLIVQLTESGVDNTSLIQLEVGDVLAFITDDTKPEFGGKRGLIKILNIEGGSAGTITIEVKVQQ